MTSVIGYTTALLHVLPTLPYSLTVDPNTSLCYSYRRYYPAPKSSSPTTRPQSHNEVYPFAKRKTCILRRGFVDETKRRDVPSEALGKKRKERSKLEGAWLQDFAFLARFQTVVRSHKFSKANRVSDNFQGRQIVALLRWIHLPPTSFCTESMDEAHANVPSTYMHCGWEDCKLFIRQVKISAVCVQAHAYIPVPIIVDLSSYP
ncbi:uncharacterized protein BO87DRAFT_401180 [Aspergillus neoniger CBS 115656]|uniref:Uncharacterized protein n=1 Tax=Aspergillus neoniger (strain CBS 115656) TaxID=1448310 RepID=A0A318YWT3_ASPNB|nr:hypothetical protein BO87DRAFT_401180 [Aspergillus neoniger CBS 115656]PYH29632.1 hypothetical protein BO87DRAFT_401180 [Aspergillus neoniger CBS 115656]